MNLHTCLQRYFTDYLSGIKGVSSETKRTYKDTFKLFLKYSSQYLSKKGSELQVEDITLVLTLSFLDYLEKQRKNKIRTRNARLVALKSFSKMIRLLYPGHRETAEMILNIPQKRFGKRLIGYMDYDEIEQVFDSVDLMKKEGFRDYTILHLLFDSGARASEVACLETEFFDPHKKTLIIKGKGGGYRRIELQPKTTELIERYIKKHRTVPKPLYSDRLFINQRREGFTRNGIYRLCKKYLSKSLPVKQMNNLNPVHSFRHSCAVNMLLMGKSLTDIKNHLGHGDLKSTMVYLHLSVSRKREAQKKFIKYIRSGISDDPKIDELLNWENKEEILDWLDDL